MKNIVRTGRHCVFVLHAHIVFVTKYRGKVFTSEHLAKMEEIFSNICQMFEAKLVEFNGEQDHVHLLIEYPPKMQLTKLINSLKGVSSRKLKQYFPELYQPAWRHDALWSPSYFCGSCGGASLEVLEKYIKQQCRPD